MEKNINFNSYTLNKDIVLKRIVFILPIFMLIMFLFIKFRFNSFYINLVQEDTIIEYAQCIAYFIACFVAFSIGLIFFKRNFKMYGTLYVLIFLCFLFIAMEEISWGQRIFNIATPAYMQEHNYQNEITVHNIRTFQFFLHHKLYIVVGFFGGFLWVLIPKNIQKKYNDLFNFFVPPWYLMFYFIPVLACYLYIDCVATYGMKGTPLIIGRDQEPAELLLSMGFLLFVLINRYRQKNFLHEKK